MRIGVFSDTHGFLHFIDKAMKVVEPVDLILHAGDISADADYIREAYNYRVYGVSGNCDTGSDYPGERLIQLEGKKILLTHGHAYRVKHGYERLLARAKDLSADAVVFGHTHCPENTRVGNVLIFNPGSLALPRCGTGRTFGVLEIRDEDIKSSIKEL
ncbi:metallophosphoesterase family protein [Thermosediminibacter oceani]|uniref:Phosphoesterase n=1 Tax=Thermosediminibacter oceani (strain ATCC BAA-1034 / DSM 16646 / JW/IW-1228P) TaxID=555079 RepID=D9RYU1_THEOJ|nr:metallophosphoesterase [Thermosediminibacter oceani]ADL08515.1 phosphodiesterase, MJ0936 family [Thermosediminibacter oceani DSM 16646]